MKTKFYKLGWAVLADIHERIYLTTRTDLGDVSHGKLVTMHNYYESFNGILNPKRLRTRTVIA